VASDYQRVAPRTARLHAHGLAPDATAPDPQNVASGTGHVRAGAPRPRVVASDHRPVATTAGLLAATGYAPRTVVYAAPWSDEEDEMLILSAFDLMGA
jgi:hypothetical protein